MNATTPAFDKEANLLAGQLAKLNATDLTKLMGVSDNIAALNVERFKSWGIHKQKRKELFFNLKAMYLNISMLEILIAMILTI
ncbi:MAG: hypothetical protein Ct9H90mP19_5350 [Gammaproteobacteria bacterium]|nr:MAG: hypothetical protein Ct9H90mP19_5350 [Gammaproteobacteria bacterium]